MMWEVVMVPVEAGVVVGLTDGQTRSVVGRVAFNRRESKRPWRSFKRALRDVIARAEAEAERLNDAS